MLRIEPHTADDPTCIALELPQVLAAVETNLATILSFFTAFQAIAGSAGGHTCNVGLLNASPQDQLACDIHPSQSGQKLIARTVEQTYVAARENAQ